MQAVQAAGAIQEAKFSWGAEGVLFLFSFEKKHHPKNEAVWVGKELVSYKYGKGERQFACNVQEPLQKYHL